MTLGLGVPDVVLLRTASRTAPGSSLRTTSTLHSLKLSTWEMEEGGSGVQSYLLQLCSRFETSLGYMRPRSNKHTKPERKTEKKGLAVDRVRPQMPHRLGLSPLVKSMQNP